MSQIQSYGSGGGGGGSGDVTGPASSTDNAIARFDGTTGKQIQNSDPVITDSGEFLSSDGSVSNPTYSFASDTDSGFYHTGTALGFAYNGIIQFEAGNTTNQSYNTMGVGVLAGTPWLRDTTSASIPSYAFRGDTNTGLRWVSADSFALMTGATDALTVDSSQVVTLTNPLPETSGGTGIASYTTGDTLYSSSSNTLSKRSIGSEDDVYRVVSGVPDWTAQTRPSTVYEQFEEWIASDYVGTYNWARVASGSGSNAFNTTGEQGHPGVVIMQTGTTNTGRVSLSQSLVSTLFGGGEWTQEWCINIDTLSTVSEEYVIRVGWGDSSGAGDHTDGIYFEYDRTSNTNWLICGQSNSTATKTDSSTAVSTGWVKLRIEVNAAASSAEYFIDDVSVGTVTTNLPSGGGFGDRVGPVIKFEKSAGTTSRSISVDYYYSKVKLTTAR